jgi:negative regulator of flagellin synthesis FlgM
METRRDLAVQKTQASEVGAEERKAQHLKQGNEPGSHARQRVVSQEQLQVQRALEAIHRSPEVRAEKINALRTQIDAGTYQIDSTSLAIKLLGITEQDAS